MMKTKRLLLGVVMGLAGCTDTADSVTREYRNTNNEAIDAMMMVTTDAQAGRVNTRIFATLMDRYNALDKKIEIMRTNREKPELAKEFLESDGVHLYLSDLSINRQRFTLELLRLKNLHKQYLDRERELLIQQGNNDPTVDPKKVCPHLNDLVNKSSILNPLKDQLLKPQVLILFSDFATWKVKDYDKLVAKFQERRKTFLPKREIDLAY